MRTIQRGLLVLCLMSTAVAARAGDSPETVVRAFTLAIQADGPAATVPRFTHPDEAARFKQILMPRIRKEKAVAEPAFVKKILGRDMPLKEIEAMPPGDFMKAFFDAQGSQVDGSKIQPPQFLGSVREKEVIHLVVRTKLTALNGVPISRLEVVSLKPLGDTWKLLLSPQLEVMLAVMLSQ